MHRFGSLVVLLVLLLTSLSGFQATAQGPSLLDLLPSAGEIGPAFVAVDTRARSLDEQAAAFANAGDAARLLAEWDWQENAFQVFQSAELSASGAPMTTLDISLTRFANAESAAAALPYFLQDRVAVLGQRELPEALNAIGDEARAIDGVVDGGYDYTLYVRWGPFLMRVSATSPSGSPATSPERIAQAIIERAGGHVQPQSSIAQPAGVFPDTLPLDHAGCFRIAGEGALDVAGVVARLAGDVSAAASTLDGLGWQDGKYRQFACDPPPGRAGWVDISVHHFRDAAAASAAVGAFAAARERGTDLEPAKVFAFGDRAAALGGPTVNGTEYTLYASRGALLFAVTGVAPTGDPQADVEAIAAALLAPTGPVQVAEGPTSTPYTLADNTPPPAPLPTATSLPTAIPLPTAPPTPTATFVPTATAIPAPTATPTEPAPPALIPVTAPTTAPAPLPTATTGPLPTPTPRVIRPPTPDAG